MCDKLHPVFMVLFLCRMCQWGLHKVRWSLIGITRMHLVAAEPICTAWLWSHSQYLCGTLFLTLFSIVWDCMAGCKCRANASLLPYYLPAHLISTFHFFLFPFLLIMGWLFGPGIVGLIGCIYITLPAMYSRHFLIMIIILTTACLGNEDVFGGYDSKCSWAIILNTIKQYIF